MTAGYDAEKCLYFTHHGYGPIPVLTHSATEMLQHLAIPQLFIIGTRLAICDQTITLDWGVCWRPDGPLPICEKCVNAVESLP